MVLSRRSALAVLTASVATAFAIAGAGCSTAPTATPPGPPHAVTSTEPRSPAGSGPAVSATVGPTTPTASRQPVPPADTLKILRADGLGSIDFGSPQDPSVLTLTDVFRSSRTASSRTCGDIAVQTEVWPELEVRFVDGRFIGYDYHQSTATERSAHLFRTPENIGLASTVAELRGAYGPQLTITSTPAGWVWATVAPARHGGLSGAPDATGSTVTAIAAGPVC